MRWVVVICAALAACLGFAAVADDASRPSVAFYYASDAPVDLLGQFDWAVVEADHLDSDTLGRLQQYGTTAFAYVSVGEADPGRRDFDQVPAAALMARNEKWNSRAADLTNAPWTDYLADKRIALPGAPNSEAVFV